MGHTKDSSIAIPHFMFSKCLEERSTLFTKGDGCGKPYIPDDKISNKTYIENMVNFVPDNSMICTFVPLL